VEARVRAEKSRSIVERRGAVAIVTLSNPAKRNALDPGLLVDLIGALGALEEASSPGAPGEAVRAVLFRSAWSRRFPFPRSR
jgi:enoyl-CoA hydratase/carnithine racemase